MARLSITGIRSIEVAVADLARAAKFYTDIWRLTEVAQEGETRYFRGKSGFHHILALTPAKGPQQVRRVSLNAHDRATVDALYGKLSGGGITCEKPHALKGPAGGYGFGFQDHAGRCFAIICDANDHKDDARVADRPYRIAHGNLNVTHQPAMNALLTELLGCRLVDNSGPQFFYHADSTDHSAIVLCKAPADTLNHVAFELPDLESVMRGSGRMIDAGYPIEWGVGRHGPGNNAFAYFAGPEEFPLEYTSDVEQIDETYEFHGPDFWKWPVGRLDHWGVTPPHTKRWHRIQNLVDFAKSGYALP